jgi:CTP synthase
MQLAVIEFARNVCGLKDANSTEFEPTTKNPVIDLMADQKSIINKGGTLRLGNYECEIEKGTLAYKDYKQTKILERHRHRYEFNNKYRNDFLENGMKLAGKSPDGELIESVELTEKRFYLGVQYHPEFKSRPNKVHPLFKLFISKSLNEEV